MDFSFFNLTAAPPAHRDDNLLDDLTEDEFDAFHAEAEPLADALLHAIQAYSVTVPDGVSMLAAWMAADIVRYSVGRDIREDEADA